MSQSHSDDSAVHHAFSSGPLPDVRYHFAAAIMPTSTNVISNGTRLAARSLLLFGGKDDWRRLDDLWHVQLHHVRLSGAAAHAKDKYEDSLAGVHKFGQHTVSRTSHSGSWESAEGSRVNQCTQVPASGVASDLWIDSCGVMGEPKGRDVQCTMDTVLRFAWCSGEFQSVGSL